MLLCVQLCVNQGRGHPLHWSPMHGLHTVNITGASTKGLIHGKGCSYIQATKVPSTQTTTHPTAHTPPIPPHTHHPSHCTHTTHPTAHTIIPTAHTTHPTAHTTPPTAHTTHPTAQPMMASLHGSCPEGPATAAKREVTRSASRHRTWSSSPHPQGHSWLAGGADTAWLQMGSAQHYIPYITTL